MKQYRNYIYILLMLLVTLFSFSGCSINDLPQAVGQTRSNTVSTTPVGQLDVYMLDIGQGDAVLLKVGNEYSMIDTGDIEHRENILSQLKSLGVTKIKNIIITHPHADHMGGFYAIAKEIPIENVYDDGVTVDNNMFKTYEKVIAKYKIKQQVLKKGDVLDFGNGAIFTVYAPWDEIIKDKKGEPDLNNNSIVGKLEFGKFSMLFTGDAEPTEEKCLITEANSKLFARVLKVAHHGSNKSSSEDFIKSVKPESALISVGMHNTYNHPGQYTLERLNAQNVEIYRTDTMGRIHIETNGEIWHISTER